MKRTSKEIKLEMVSTLTDTIHDDSYSLQIKNKESITRRKQ